MSGYTRYEVVATRADGARWFVALTARHNRSGLLNASRGRGEEVVAALGVTDADPVRFVAPEDNGGRWAMVLGDKGRVEFSGRTEKDVEDAFRGGLGWRYPDVGDYGA